MCACTKKKICVRHIIIYTYHYDSIYHITYTINYILHKVYCKIIIQIIQSNSFEISRACHCSVINEKSLT